MKKRNIGSTFDSWLREEGLYEEVSATAITRVVARQVEAAMEQKGLTKAEMARRMHTSRPLSTGCSIPKTTPSCIFKAGVDSTGRSVIGGCDLDVFQSLQRKGIRYMLALTGLPTLFPKLVEARTFAERMFHIVFLNPLTEKETTEAIRKPIQKESCPEFSEKSIKTIWTITRGYPYFVQYVCREVFDVWVQAIDAGQENLPSVPIKEIIRKLDSDFFAGRWAKSTDRQRELLRIIAGLPNCDAEFTVQEVVETTMNRELARSFSSSHVNQMLASLSDAGLVYKNRHGRYSFAVPLLGDFIQRQQTEGSAA